MYFTKRWKWIELNCLALLGHEKNVVQTLWDTHYKNVEAGIFTVTSIAVASISRDFIAFDHFLDVSNNNIDFSEDSYTIYCEFDNRISSRDYSDFDIIDWWRDHTDQTMTRLGWDMLVISTMSSECERVFNSAGRLITSIRSSLKDNTIETCECLRAWIL